MTLARKALVGLLVFLGLCAATVFIALPASANPSRTVALTSCTTQGAAATTISTTSISFMTAGTGTSTLTCNMGSAGVEVFDTASLTIQFTASSTGSILNTAVEYSQDGIDWYSDRLSLGATTTNPVGIGQANSLTWQFASSSIGGAGVANNNNFATRVVSIATPERFVRVIFSMPTGSTAGGVWAQLVGKVETVR